MHLSPLSSRDAHVWLARLDDLADLNAELRAILSTDETERADRFAFEHLRRRFIAGRGLLRLVLGSYLEVDPAALRFRYGPQGKPALDGHDLSFNLSHCADLAALAVLRQGRVGIDIEQIRPLEDRDAIAAAHFSDAENATLQSLPEDQRTAAFFRCWTRKEAFVKAQGEGLSYPLQRFDVSLGGPPTLRIPGDAAETERWHMYDLQPVPDHAAALVIEGLPRRVVAEWISRNALPW